MARGKIHRVVAVALSAAFCLSLAASLAKADDKQKKQKSTGPADSDLQDYLKRVGASAPNQPASLGSLWTPYASYGFLAADYKARSVGDLITVELVDSFSAATNGENSTSRAFSTQSGISGLVGQIGPAAGLQNLFNAGSNTSLDGKGASTMSSNLQVNLAGHVVQVLPNGVMVIEAVRDFTVGNDRQTIVVRGLVRPGDVSTANTIVSSQIGSLELQIKGKGAVADASARPNIVIRTLLKLLSF